MDYITFNFASLKKKKKKLRRKLNKTNFNQIAKSS